EGLDAQVKGARSKVRTIQIVEAAIRRHRSADVLIHVIVVVVKVREVEPVGAVYIQAQLSDGVHLLSSPRHNASGVVTHLQRVDKFSYGRRNQHLSTFSRGLPFDRCKVERPVANKRSADGAA